MTTHTASPETRMFAMIRARYCWSTSEFPDTTRLLLPPAVQTGHSTLIGHCVTPGTPSSQFVSNMRMPCQWTAVPLKLVRLLYTVTP